MKKLYEIEKKVKSIEVSIDTNIFDLRWPLMVKRQGQTLNTSKWKYIVNETR